MTSTRTRAIADWLRRRAENVAVLLLATMFLAFIAQVVFRYVLNLPIGWPSEVTVATWLWLVLWGAAFVVREDEEIRFDLVYGAVPSMVRSIMTVVSGLALLVLYVVSLPAVIDYVTFMKVESTTYLHIRLDWLYSIYVVFAAAIVVRYVWIVLDTILHGDRVTRQRADDPGEPGA
ncbi:TRAP transporter small permease [Amorphus sp. MBR-141]